MQNNTQNSLAVKSKITKQHAREEFQIAFEMIIATTR